MWDVLMKYEKFQNFRLIAVIHHFAILCNALSNPKVRIISMHLMHPLIFEYHPGQSPQPFE
jgi:hypothetical protein